jgi:hypothetical protein
MKSCGHRLDVDYAALDEGKAQGVLRASSLGSVSREPK